MSGLPGKLLVVEKVSEAKGPKNSKGRNLKNKQSHQTEKPWNSREKPKLSWEKKPKKNQRLQGGGRQKTETHN